MFDVIQASGLASLISAVITAYVTIRVTKIKQVGASIERGAIEIKPTGSNRLSLDSNEKLNEGTKVYKTRIYDKVRATISGTVSREGDKIVIIGNSHIATYIGIECFATEGVAIEVNEEIGVVTNFQNGEGILKYTLHEKFKEQQQ